MKDEPLTHAWIIYIPYVSIGFFQLISFTMLASGVLTIRRLILQNDSSEFNNRMLLMHIFCFALYLMISLVICCRTLIATKVYSDEIYQVVVFATVSLVLFVIMMSALLAILYHIGAARPIRFSSETADPSETQPSNHASGEFELPSTELMTIEEQDQGRAVSMHVQLL